MVCALHYVFILAVTGRSCQFSLPVNERESVIESTTPETEVREDQTGITVIDDLPAYTTVSEVREDQTGITVVDDLHTETTVSEVREDQTGRTVVDDLPTETTVSEVRKDQTGRTVVDDLPTETTVSGVREDQTGRTVVDDLPTETTVSEVRKDETGRTDVDDLPTETTVSEVRKDQTGRTVVDDLPTEITVSEVREDQTGRTVVDDLPTETTVSEVREDQTGRTVVDDLPTETTVSEVREDQTGITVVDDLHTESTVSEVREDQSGTTVVDDLHTETTVSEVREDKTGITVVDDLHTETTVSEVREDQSGTTVVDDLPTETAVSTSDLGNQAKSSSEEPRRPQPLNNVTAPSPDLIDNYDSGNDSQYEERQIKNNSNSFEKQTGEAYIEGTAEETTATEEVVSNSNLENKRNSLSKKQRPVHPVWSRGSGQFNIALNNNLSVSKSTIPVPEVREDKNLTIQLSDVLPTEKAESIRDTGNQAKNSSEESRRPQPLNNVTATSPGLIDNYDSGNDSQYDKRKIKNNTNSFEKETGEAYTEDPAEETTATEEVVSNSNLENKRNSLSKEQRIVQQGTSLSVKVFIGQDDYVSVLDMDKGKRDILEVENGSFYSIDYVYNDSLVFFTDNNNLIRATLKRGITLYDPEVIVDEEEDGKVMLAVDWVHRKLYWMAEKYQTVMTADLDGKNSRIFVTNITMNFEYPNNIVVDPYVRSVFFVNNHAVYKSDVDGGNAEVVPIESNNPGEVERGVRTIALDRKNKKIYYSGREQEGSENTHYLARVNYDGFGIQDFNMSGLNDIYSMDVLGDTLYFAHYQEYGYAENKSCPDVVMSASTDISDVFRPRKIFIPKTCGRGIWSVKVYHPCAQNPSCDVIDGPL